MGACACTMLWTLELERGIRRRYRWEGLEELCFLGRCGVGTSDGQEDLGTREKEAETG